MWGTVSGQDDVVELNNRVNVEYRELMEANPQLLSYLGELGNQVDIAVGVRLAEQVASSEPAQGDNTVPAEGSEQGTEGTQTPDPNTEAQTGPQSAVATTTVNVRNSDSELADKLGQVEGGAKCRYRKCAPTGGQRSSMRAVTAILSPSICRWRRAPRDRK